MTCRRRTRRVRRGKTSKSRRTTPSANGRSGWHCGSGNLPNVGLPRERTSARRKLRLLLKELNARRLARLEALLAVADREASLLITGNGDVLDPEAGIIAIGSGGNYALAAAKALTENTEMGARAIVEQSLKIAADICIYTNHNRTIEEL